MTIDQIAQAAAILSVTVPLCALAWSAITYVRLRQREVQRERRQRFFEVLEHFVKQGGSEFEFRKFPESSDVIIRLFDQVDVEGHSASMLKA
ncbi:hypothetical protein [Methylocapsa palsarum]|uniref:hypothetical protein n=1 Tax=Methylocapsa palsarum TaxID=1612308 RepID=UPI0011134268|nr:hypothetical protein [Methylocapsa palsarum]